MKHAGAWLWVIVAAVLMAVAAPMTVQAAGGTVAAKPKPDAGK